jgi:hypothetical protein
MALLLHSLVEFKEIICDALQLAGPQTVVEVGSETGMNTRPLARWVGERGAVLYCVEPHPGHELVAFAEQADHVRVLQDYSPEALAAIGPADAYLLDGDHNYFTVSRELATIAQVNEAFPLVILNDVGWPCARRDQYYDPDRLPAEAVHPHTWTQGVTLDHPGTVQGGFRGEGQFAYAEHEGGPRNGVLTAVEDFIAERVDLHYAQVPCVFGLGVLWSRSSSWSTKLMDLLAPLDQNPLLERLERNRLALFLRVLALQDEMAQHHVRHDRTVAAYETTLGRVNADHAALRLRLAELETSGQAGVGGGARAGRR